MNTIHIIRTWKAEMNKTCLYNNENNRHTKMKWRWVNCIDLIDPQVHTNVAQQMGTLFCRLFVGCISFCVQKNVCLNPISLSELLCHCYFYRRMQELISCFEQTTSQVNSNIVSFFLYFSLSISKEVLQIVDSKSSSGSSNFPVLIFVVPIKSRVAPNSTSSRNVC